MLYPMANPTSINLTSEQKELLKKAASHFGLKYQTYLKSVVLEHAKRVLSKKDIGIQHLIEIPNRPRMEIFTDEP